MIKRSPLYKQYPNYKDSGIEWLGEIPAHWEVKRLKFVAHIEAGQSPPSEVVTDGSDGLPFLQGNADFGLISPLPRQICDVAPKRARAGHILLSVRAPVGALNIADQEYGIGRGLCAIGFNPVIHQRFGFYTVVTTRKQLGSVATGSTYDAVTASDVGGLPQLLPPEPEQRAIADFLDRETAKIDALIEKKERLIELLKEKRTALISHAVTKGLDPNVPMKDSGIEWLGKIPAHWEVIPLKWRARCSSGNAIQVNSIASSSEGYSQIHVVGGNGLMGYTSKANVVIPVLVIGRVGALCGNVHRVDPPAWVTDNALILQVDTQTFVYSYLYAMLLSRNLNDLAAKTAQPLITGTQVLNQRLPCPPLSEQQAIADFLDHETAKIDALIGKIEEAIKLLKEYRTALISAAVTGKIDVRRLVEKREL